MRRIEIVPVGEADAGLLEALGHELDRRLGTVSAPGERLPLSPEWWDGERGRYLSGPIVDALLERADRSGRDLAGHWWLGVAEAQLCAPEFDVVFGEATVAGPCAVVGLGSLRAPSSEGVPLLWQRLVTSAVHELGHLAGAEHCADPGCVMYPSRDLADTDRKGESFCNTCMAQFSAQ
jgi:archaemetzincin